jgi:murein DD-endopeptidase MepM/ murein hydrolase activator NlpD
VSTNKLKVDGKLCYSHIVLERQTLYSICKAYNVTAEDLYKYNPGLKENGLKKNGILIIPAVSTEASAVQEQPKKDTVAIQAPAPKEAEPAPTPKSEKTGFLPSMPCDGELSSEFGERIHPLSGDSTFHNGIDIALDEGDPVTACFDGEVITSEYNDYSGNYVIIKHIDDYTSSYAHMSRLEVPVGTLVKKGDVIGLAGSTGSATGPHLHFEIRRGGTPLDPWKMIEMND